jgi:hypothetical protein
MHSPVLAYTSTSTTQYSSSASHKCLVCSLLYLITLLALSKHDYYITLWIRALLGKLRDPRLFKKFTAFYGNRRYISVFTINRYISVFTINRYISVFTINRYISVFTITRYISVFTINRYISVFTINRYISVFTITRYISLF